MNNIFLVVLHHNEENYEQTMLEIGYEIKLAYENYIIYLPRR